MWFESGNTYFNLDKYRAFSKDKECDIILYIANTDIKSIDRVTCTSQESRDNLYKKLGEKVGNMRDK